MGFASKANKESSSSGAIASVFVFDFSLEFFLRLSGSMIKVMSNKCEVSGLEFEMHNPCSKGSDHDRTPDRSLPASDQMRHAHAGVDCNAVIDASSYAAKAKIAARLSQW